MRSGKRTETRPAGPSVAKGAGPASSEAHGVHSVGDWLLAAEGALPEGFHPSYGDVTALNADGLIKRSIDPAMLNSIVFDFLALLGTSCAIYEQNGDYVFCIFSSGWCRRLDEASFRLCGTEDLRQALACGQWLCHESCWTYGSRSCIMQNAPVDIECNGGLRIYAVPIQVDGTAVGSINFGNNSPPRDPQTLQAIAAKYGVAYADLAEEAARYPDRPTAIVELARKRLANAARQIGILVKRRLAEERLRESEQCCRTALLHSNFIFAQSDRELRYIWIHNAHPDFVPETVIGKRDAEVADNEGTRQLMRVKQEVLATARGVRCEIAFPVSNGLRIYEVIAEPIWDSAGQASGVATCALDITDRKRAEVALRESEERLRLAHKATNDAVWDWDVVHDTQRWNEAGITVFGWTEIVERPVDAHWWVERVHPEDRQRVHDTFFAVVNDPRSDYWHDEYRFRKADGTYAEVMDRGYVLRDPQGKAVRMIGAMLDITQRKRSEEALRASQQRLALATASAHMGVWDWDIVNNQMTWDDQMFRLYGIQEKPGAYGVEVWEKGLHPDDRAYAWEACQAAVRGEKPYDIEFRVRHPDGTVRHIKAVGIVLRDEGGRPVRMLGVNYDITERKQAEVTLVESYNMTQAIVNSTDDLIWTVDAARHGLTMWNKAVENYFRGAKNLSLSAGMRPEDLFSANSKLPREWHHYYDRAATRGAFTMEKTLSDGVHVLLLSFNPVMRDGKVFGIAVFGKDITERQRAEIALRDSENRLRQAEKMNAIGQLAGGVAHDFNNQLAGVLGYAEMLSNRLSDPNLKRYAENIRTAALRSADLTKKLLAFSRKGQFQRVPNDVHRVIQETAEMLLHSIDKRIRINQRLNARRSLVVGDPSQIQNALLNLSVNARDAMPEGGELTLGTDTVSIDAADNASRGCDVPPGEYLIVTVEDTGCGMTPEVKAHLFEPFFTTKEVGRGTGMGLASVFGTVKQHGGAINVYSEVGKGTIFRIYLPLAEQACQDTTEEYAGTTTPARTHRILIVDDEEIVRQLAAELLEQAGHETRTASDGPEAVEVFRRDAGRYDLVILDMVMPTMNGRDTFRALKAIDPKIKTILASGFSLNEDSQAILGEGALGFVQKPFEERELLAAVNAAVCTGGSR